MFCTNCEFEIKGEGREKCPICGGPLLDFSLLDSEAQEGEKGTPEEKQTGSSQEPTDTPTLDLASLLNDDEEATKQETEPQAPADEELPIENIEPHTFKNAGEEPDIATSESKESTPFDLGDALITDDEKHDQEAESRHGETHTFGFETTPNEADEQQSGKPEEPAQVSPASEYQPEPGPEPPLEELSTEELLRRIAEEYKPTEEKVAPPPAKPQPVQARSSRSITAIAALAVFALIAAIASVAFLTPQEKLHPVIENLKTETEQKISTISHILMAKAENYLTEKEEPELRIPLKKTQPDRTVKKVALYKKPPVQKEVPLVEEKPTSTHKTDSGNGEQTVTKELTQPLANSAEETLSLPQKNAPPQITEEKEETPVKHTKAQGTRKITYSLHTGSFTKESIASAESERLMRMGFKSYVEKVSLENGQTWYRIKVGSFSTREEAEAIQDELKQKAPHIKSYIMRKKVSSKTAVTGEVAEKTREVAIINPAASARSEKTPSHEKPDVVETGPPINGTVTGEEAYSPEKAVALETEQTNPEMDHDPYIQETVEEEIPVEDTVSIETLLAVFPEQEDQASVTMDIFPEMGLQEEGVITPVE